MEQVIKLLIVDDSALMRRIIHDAVRSDRLEIEMARNGEEALELAASFKPDVMTLDVEMPGQSGLDVLQELQARHSNISVIMFSSLTSQGADATFKALELGAADFLAKPQSAEEWSSKGLKAELVKKIIALGSSEKSVRAAASDLKAADYSPEGAFEILSIGTSTGGPAALAALIPRLPANLPMPVTIIQHMPEGFTGRFAHRLDALTDLKVVEVSDGEVLKPGTVYLGRGNNHFTVEKEQGVLVARSNSDIDKIQNHRPSIDLHFKSLARACGKRVIAVIMTGMGWDGVEGLGELHNQGAFTLGQDESTSVIYGMNKRARDKGYVLEEYPLGALVDRINEVVGKTVKTE